MFASWIAHLAICSMVIAQRCFIRQNKDSFLLRQYNNQHFRKLFLRCYTEQNYQKDFRKTHKLYQLLHYSTLHRFFLLGNVFLVPRCR